MRRPHCENREDIQRFWVTNCSSHFLERNCISGCNYQNYRKQLPALQNMALKSQALLFLNLTVLRAKLWCHKFKYWAVSMEGDSGKIHTIGTSLAKRKTKSNKDNDKRKLI